MIEEELPTAEMDTSEDSLEDIADVEEEEDEELASDIENED